MRKRFIYLMYKRFCVEDTEQMKFIFAWKLMLVEFRINLENNIVFHLIKKPILRCFWIQSGGPAFILSLPNMKLNNWGYFIDEKATTQKKRYREMLSCAGQQKENTGWQDQCPDPRLLPGQLFSLLLKFASKPGPWVTIGGMKHPFAMKYELFLVSQTVLIN